MDRARGSLWAGIAGTASFIVVFLINDGVKTSYDPMRDLVSEAAIGQHGWVQIASFIVTGALLAFSSVALSRTAGGRTGALVGIAGVSLALAGVFVSDPVPHEHRTWHGSAHTIVSLVVFASLTAACVTAARWRPAPPWRRYCLATAVAIPVMFVIAGAAGDLSGLWQRLTIGVGWSWLIVLHLRALTSFVASGERTTSIAS